MILCNIMYFGFVGMISAVVISKVRTNAYTFDLFILSGLFIGTGHRTVNLLTHDDIIWIYSISKRVIVTQHFGTLLF